MSNMVSDYDDLKMVLLLLIGPVLLVLFGIPYLLIKLSAPLVVILLGIVGNFALVAYIVVKLNIHQGIAEFVRSYLQI